MPLYCEKNTRGLQFAHRRASHRYRSSTLTKKTWKSCILRQFIAEFTYFQCTSTWTLPNIDRGGFGTKWIIRVYGWRRFFKVQWHCQNIIIQEFPKNTCEKDQLSKNQHVSGMLPWSSLQMSQIKCFSRTPTVRSVKLHGGITYSRI